MTSRLNYVELDDYEQEIEDNFENLSSYSTEIEKEKTNRLQQAAKNHLEKEKRITLKIYNTDLERLKKLADKEGVTYQNYIINILHKISLGRLKDITG